MNTRLSAVAALLAAAGYPLGAQAPREPWPGYDAYVTAALATWKVPGVAIAVVRNDSLIYAKGYGVKEAGKPGAVGEQTFFAIGSASKAFTAAALAMMVDEKKVRWDDAAALHLPALQLYDPYATRELSVRDILSHRSGLARGDMVWYGTEFDRDEILRRVRFLQPSWSFRSQFGYQNLMYLAAGQLAARVDNASWDDVIRRRIFTPLGMTASNTSIRPLASMPDVATPHAEIDDTVRAIPWRNIDNVGPAGSINSNVVEMSRWVRLQLGQGKLDGKQLISAAQVEQMHRPHTIVDLVGGWKLVHPESNFATYGLGWFLADYKGKKIVHHGGNIDGMSAMVAMIPSEKFGVVILTNMNGTTMTSALMYKTFDLHLRAPARDWSAELRKTVDSLTMLGRRAVATAERQRKPNTRPSLALAEYAGVYVDSMYGETRVRADSGGVLRITRGPAFEGPLEHWHFDTFRAKWAARHMGTAFVGFRVGASGKVEDLQIDLGGTPVTFRRRPDAPATATSATPGR